MRKHVLWLIIAVFSVSCQPGSNQPSTIVTHSHGQPGGWLADGSQFMISAYGLQPVVRSADDLSFPLLPANNKMLSRASGACARWSPDGTAVLYIDYEPRPNSNPLAKFYLLSDATVQPSLIMTGTSLSCPSWSPDSQEFVVGIDQGNTTILRIFDKSNRSYRDLYSGSISLATPAWSPDKQLIAATEDDQIILVDSVTSQRVQTGLQAVEGIEPTWAPNSQYVAYIDPSGGMAGNAGNLIVIKIDGTEKQMLVGINKDLPQSGDYLYSSPMWSPRGDYIAVERIPVGIHDLQQRYEKADIVMVPIPDSLKQVTMP